MALRHCMRCGEFFLDQFGPHYGTYRVDHPPSQCEENLENELANLKSLQIQNNSRIETIEKWLKDERRRNT